MRVDPVLVCADVCTDMRAGVHVARHRLTRGAASLGMWRGIAGHVAQHRWACGAGIADGTSIVRA